MTRVYLEDQGQDLKQFDFDETQKFPKIISDCNFNGHTILNLNIAKGVYIRHTPSIMYNGFYQMKEPIIMIKTLAKPSFIDLKTRFNAQD